MEGKAKILVFGFSEEEQRRIDQGLASLGVPPAQKIRPAQRGMAVRRILTGEGEGPDIAEAPVTEAARQPAAEQAVVQERLVLFHNLSDAGVQALMRFFRETLTLRPIFAVVTPTSIGWTLGELLSHLVQERAALEKGR